MRKTKYFSFILAIVFLFTMLIIWSLNNYQQKRDYLNQQQIKNVKNNYHATTSTYALSAAVIYEQIMLDTLILNTLEAANTPTKEIFYQLSLQLKQKIKKLFTSIEKNGYSDLQIFTKEGVKLLSFQNKGIGENIFGSRYSITIAQKENRNIHGLEKGNSSYKYRNIFPIVYDSIQIGTIELSISFPEFVENYNRIARHKNILHVLEKPNGNISEITDQNLSITQFMNGFVVANNSATQRIIMCAKRNENNFKKAIEKTKANAINVELKNIYYTITFLPITDIQGYRVGTLIKARKTVGIKEIAKDLHIQLILLSIGFLITLALIFYIVKTESRLVNANQKAKKAEAVLIDTSATKDSLFYIINHDLKNHFNAVHGFTNLLKLMDENLDKKTTKLVTGLSDSVLMTSMLINNLFTYAQIQTKKIEIKPNHFEISRWTKQEIKAFTSIAKRREIRIDNQTKTPTYINADKDYLTLLFRNIVHNAIKYADKNSKIEILITDNQASTIITVKNQGKGLTKNEIGAIMQNDIWTGSTNNKGAGLGLILARRITELHQGDFELESAPGVYVVTKITIPK